MKAVTAWVLRIAAAPVLLLAALWAAAALFIDGPGSRLLSGALFAVLAAAAALLLRGGPRRRARLACAAFVLVFGGVLVWWRGIEPSNDRPWQPDVARLARARIAGDRVTFTNVRNFEYRSEADFTERWEERTFDLSRLAGADMYLCSWGSPDIAHTIVSWRFADSPPLAISIETRKEIGEGFSTVRGFFRQYELYYVVADERDLIRLRTDFRGEEVRLYNLKIPLATARAVLLDYCAVLNDLNEQPRWYNALVHNCTTTIRLHARHVAAAKPFDWRILLNGHLDELGYARGTIDTRLPFEELRQVSRINDAARAAGGALDFSTRIRAGLPGMGM